MTATTTGGAPRGASDPGFSLKRLRAARTALLRVLEGGSSPEMVLALALVEDQLCALLAARRREEVQR